MGLHTISYRVKNRWIKTVDRWGEEIRLVNPNPTVLVNVGRWTQRKSMDERHVEHVKFSMTASEFRDMTGIMVYGGNGEPPGTQKRTVPDRIQRRIDIHVSSMERSTSKPRRTRKQPQVPDRLKDIQEGRIGQLKGVKCIRRKRS